MALNRVKNNLFLTFIVTLPLIADNGNSSTLPSNKFIHNVPKFSINYQDEALVCSPTGLIKTKTHKDLVIFECKKASVDEKGRRVLDMEPGHAETKRLSEDVQSNIAQGTTYTVEIPIHKAYSPTKARLIAELQLNNMPYGKYLHMLLPAKFYLSIRPQFANSGNNGEMKFRSGGSRGGFFYYHQFNHNLELMFQYEAGLNINDNTRFINTSDTLDSNRRLSYFALKYNDYSLILGKYWSSYYDIAAFTDRYMAYGAKSSGAFNSATDGSPSGTGRSDYMLQVRTNKDTYDATLQIQSKHNAFRGFETDYSYTAAGSFIYKGWENIKLGASVNYGEFDDVTDQMETFNIDGNDISSIIGMSYQKNNYAINAIFSYTENHMSDDQGIYFDSMGAELYMHYDIDENYRLAAGGNWLIPRDDTYNGQYSLRDLIFSFQYTFGEKTFDDLIYVEVSLPNGKLANGESRSTNIAIGLRYLLDN